MSLSASRISPLRFHGLVAFAMSLVLATGGWWLLGLGGTWPLILVSWLSAVNVVAFVYYGYDKARARRGGRRVPEVVLHGLAGCGGSAGALLAMHCFRHKTVKGSFRIVFWLIVLLQLTLLAWLIKVIIDS